MSHSNPFSSLIAPPAVPSVRNFNSILEDIFGFTLDQEHGVQKQIVYLDEIAKSFSRKELDLQVLQHALFDRLFMCGDDTLTKSKDSQHNSHAYESKVVVYLYNCYRNLNGCGGFKDDEKVKSLIVQNTATAFIQAEIYSEQDLEEQFINILKEGCVGYVSFFKDVCKGILEDEDGGDNFLKDKLTEILFLLTSEIKESRLSTFDVSIFKVLTLFTIDEYLASIFLDTKPAKFAVGSDYANTPLGVILNISILPKVPSAPYEHFQDPTDQATRAICEGRLWDNVNNLMQLTHSFVVNLLLCSPQIKCKTLKWIGQCLKANADRRKLWNSQAPPELNPANYTNVSDGFMNNLGHLMLKLCERFCSKLAVKKILEVDPTYCGVPNELLVENHVHLPDMAQETCLIPRDAEKEILLASKYNFITEVFHLAHKAIDLGFQVTVDKIFRLNQEVGRIERTYADVLTQNPANVDLIDSVKRRMTLQLSKYLSMRAQVSNPNLLNLLFDFVSATSYWLCQVAVHFTQKNPETYAPLNEIPITFPLNENVPSTLEYIPEFLVENTVCYLVFLRRFSPRVFEEQRFDKMKPILTFILTFMGSPQRIRNPHVRARLAEALESLLPHYDDENPQLNTFGSYEREMLFTQHEHRGQILSNLLQVFVGIEMTGQSVEFEQKFNYRRPMYTIMDYLWTKPEYQTGFKNLAEEAEQNMNAVTPPLFLRFINLLMNDAVFLLDEALTNMAKLKEMETARENGDWNSLPAQERNQNLNYMHHIGMIAKFDNILGRDTIKTIEKLTSHITIVFTHSTMVDRVAAMLNYFLYNLVGPNKKNFKVKDQKEYAFEPANTVLNICKIYVNLKESDAFCLAISQDGRSYSPQLFGLAEDVLIRIGGGLLIGELKEIAIRVEEKARENQVTEVAIAEAPDHFMDPIMSTIMSDPVILPSSRQIVDRTTIARHLLSDQTDPFNRAPLSMDQVIPNIQLAEEIRKWVEERKNK